MLRLWMRDGEHYGLRCTHLADGGVLRAAMTVRTPAQAASFCAPWHEWWLSDWDSQAMTLVPPTDALPSDSVTSVRWSGEQFKKLIRLCRADQLLQPLKDRVQSAPSLESREARHRVATEMLALVEHEYPEERDQTAWIGWALQLGGCPTGLGEHPAHARHWRARRYGVR
ncbi:hypothetical protein VPH47_04355 [Stenotrophomonas sp. WED208]|uniref:hypothetical protein n=1 Tax=Stenotrophomonas sp. WED208 TaxID=3112800 RepID=UPI0034D54410